MDAREKLRAHLKARPSELAELRRKGIKVVGHPPGDYLPEELGIPVLPLEWDCYDARDYSAESLRTRIETFAEVVRARKAAKRGD